MEQTSCAPELSLLSPTPAHTQIFSLLHPVIADVLKELLPCKKFRSLLAAAGTLLEQDLGCHTAALLKDSNRERKGRNSAGSASDSEKSGLSSRGGNPHGRTGHCSPRGISPGQTLHPGLTLLSWHPRHRKSQEGVAEMQKCRIQPHSAAFAQPSALSSPCVVAVTL